MTTKTPNFDRVYNLFESTLNQVELSNTQCKEIANFRTNLQLFALNQNCGPRNTELTAILIEKISKLASELFTNPENLKPLSEWSDFEKGLFFTIGLKYFAAQTHGIKIIDRIYARLKDVNDFAHLDSTYLRVLLGLSTAALLLTTAIVMTCFTAPLVALPLFGLLGMAIKGLHAFITIPDTHSNELVRDQEVTNLCQILLEEINNLRQQRLAQQVESSNSANPTSDQEVRIPETRVHGRFTLPLSFFKPHIPDISTQLASDNAIQP